MRPSTILLSFLPWLALGCGGQVDPDVLAAELLEADRAFARAVAEGGLEAWIEHFASDGRMVLPGGSAVGQDAIREIMAPAFADSTYTLAWEPEHAAASASGDFGYTTGRYESRRVLADGSAATRTGRYVSVWRRQADGRWLLEADIGNVIER